MNQRDATSREEGMGKLSAAQRRKLPVSDFAEPGKRKYPVNDKGHAKAALSRVEHNGTPAEKKAVVAKVRKKFPGMTLKSRGESGRTRKYTGKKRKKGTGKR
jgi:hypothetical protein